MSKKITTAALRPTLEEVRSQFEAWRKTKRPGNRIPDVLWQAAVELCRDHSILDVSRALRLSYNDLKNRAHKARDLSPAAAKRSARFGFVEFDLGASITPAECMVEMEAPNGAKMKMYFKGAQRDFDPVELSRAFWRQGL